MKQVTMTTNGKRNRLCNRRLFVHLVFGLFQLCIVIPQLASRTLYSLFLLRRNASHIANPTMEALIPCNVCTRRPNRPKGPRALIRRLFFCFNALKASINVDRSTKSHTSECFHVLNPGHLPDPDVSRAEGAQCRPSHYGELLKPLKPPSVSYKRGPRLPRRCRERDRTRNDCGRRYGWCGVKKHHRRPGVRTHEIMTAIEEVAEEEDSSTLG